MRTLVFVRPIVLSFPMTLLSCGSRSDSGGSTADAALSSGNADDATNGTSASSSGSGESNGGSDASSAGSSGEGGEGGPSPSVSISFPVNGITVGSAMGTVPVSFETTNFILVPPDDPSCTNSSELCGHVHLFVDGSACTPPGQAYNDDGESSPIDAILTSCPSVGGTHTAVLELHHNDHSPVIGADGVVSASVTFSAI